MKKRHYPTDSVIYIKAHTYKSIADRLTDADKDDAYKWKIGKKNSKRYSNTALFYIARYLKVKTRIYKYYSCSHAHVWFWEENIIWIYILLRKIRGKECLWHFRETHWILYKKKRIVLTTLSWLCQSTHLHAFIYSR